MGDRGPQPPELPGLHLPGLNGRGPGEWGSGGEAPGFINFKITHFVISSRFPVRQWRRGYNRNGTACAVRRWLCRPVNSNSGWQVLMVGGNWNNGSNAGLFYFNANNSSSNSNGNIGARLLVFPMSSLRRLFRTAW